jgi:hypothetical protein
MTELEIFREVKVGKCGYDMTENKQGEKSHENHRKKISGQKISHELDRLKIDQHTGGNNEHGAAENKTQPAHDDGSPPFSAL